MIIAGSKVKVADNSGAQLVECIKVLGGSKKRFARVGDLIVVSVKKALPNSRVKKGGVYLAFIVATRSASQRVDGSSIRFDSNFVVVLSKNKDIIGTRILTPVSSEIRGTKVQFDGLSRILSLAPEVI